MPIGRVQQDKLNPMEWRDRRGLVAAMVFGDTLYGAASCHSSVVCNEVL